MGPRAPLSRCCRIVAAAGDFNVPSEWPLGRPLGLAAARRRRSPWCSWFRRSRGLVSVDWTCDPILDSCLPIWGVAHLLRIHTRAYLLSISSTSWYSTHPIPCCLHVGFYLPLQVLACTCSPTMDLVKHGAPCQSPELEPEEGKFQSPIRPADPLPHGILFGFPALTAPVRQRFALRFLAPDRPPAPASSLAQLYDGKGLITTPPHSTPAL